MQVKYLKIFRLYLNGMPVQKIAEHFDLHWKGIRQIIGKVYKEIECTEDDSRKLVDQRFVHYVNKTISELNTLQSDEE
ncbi:hypothetical protein PEPS_12570 [Persicobacter psychrovividus]|uniref:Helix-turn-helix domain-containing protein n=2 Tax=Persicobacter psychrovividus TaxID=387638 RepID=A0ABM7VE71_9BACT|nr:hypothetical protein PEPS_12570 [Persicobacter psychrovividus]